VKSRAPAPSVQALRELALDLRWSWNHSADELWSQLEPELWALTHNPWVVLQTVSRARLAEFLARTEFRQRIKTLLDVRRRHLVSGAWFQRSYPKSALTRVAYFSMEFALSEGLPIYSGGLGNVAGDQLKAACDLGVPVIGVGLLYQQGYFRQVIRADGRQEALYPYNDPGQLPITPVRDANGEWLRLEFPLAGQRMWLRAWRAQVGRRTLLLLDSNDLANPPASRAITSELYGGGAELRLQQELVLGVGGWRLLRTLGLTPDVCHLNEGHAALTVLERARSFMEDTGHPFEVALAVTRAGNLFTTHTPVAAGFDRFSPDLIEQYLRGYAENDLRISARELLALGRKDPSDSAEPFTMAYLAIRGSGAVNGVSRLHGAVSRRLLTGLFPRWPESEVPVGHVTNGVHTPTWDSAAADELWTRACGGDRWRDTMETVARDLRCVSDADLWAFRSATRKMLVDYVRDRMTRERASAGATPEEATRARQCPPLDPDVLTLGLARRFATYKRPNLLLHSPERLLRLLSDSERPIQLVIAGKAHPADRAGEEMIGAWLRFIRRPEVQGRIVFVPDYDLLLAEYLVQGVDLWVNTPRRPWEACGTSGMKVLVNGGLNLSELDGWWAEAYSPDVGWALGDGQEHGDDPAWDAAEAATLYARLEREIVPAFYSRDARGMPTAWIARMRESMARLTPQFSANRVVREYTEQHYLPAAARYRRRAADKAAVGAQLVAWRRHLDEHWHGAHFGGVRVDTREGQHRFSVEVYFGSLDPDAVRVELFADSIDGEKPRHRAMTRGREIDVARKGFEYTGSAPASRAADDYTVRLVPYHPEAAGPLEATQILWQR
jgi:glycogen phosphorylase